MEDEDISEFDEAISALAEEILEDEDAVLDPLSCWSCIEVQLAVRVRQIAGSALFDVAPKLWDADSLLSI